MTRHFPYILIALSLAALPGCAAPPKVSSGGQAPKISSVSLNDLVQPAPLPGGVELSAAKNEWASFVLEISNLPLAAGHSLQLRTPQLRPGKGSIALTNFEAYQILPMPVDVNRAGYVRHTGLSTAVRDLPRALLPLAMNNGVVDLRTLRDPRHPATHGPLAGTAHLWIDLHLPSNAPAGEYAATCDLLDGSKGKPLASVPLKLTVYDFALPDAPHLQMVSRVSWDDLQRLYPGFETVRPRLLSRGDARYAAAIRTLDQLVALAQRHRTIVTFPRLQPTVKWPADAPPQVDWTEFDSVVRPWLKGEIFADRQPLRFWPLPGPDFLDRFDRRSQVDYWSLAATHFDQNDWIGHSAVWIEKLTPGFATIAQSRELSVLAADTLKAHPRIKAMVPLEDDQLALLSASNNVGIDPALISRIWATGKGLVFAPSRQPWPQGAARPEHWLRTDLPGLVPYVGAGGDERDVRLWAWLAFLSQARIIVWNSALPTLSDPAKPADPNELIWFYPGEWFGIDQPAPTIQLKWLRRAQQDFEYLTLAKDRGEVLNSLVMARLITNPVEIQPGQVPDPSYALMCGTTDPQAWADAQRLLAQSILLRQPGKPVDENQQHAIYVSTLRWSEPQERPLLMGRTAQWWIDPKYPGWLQCRLGLDVYNASGDTPNENRLQWTGLPAGWQIRPQPIPVPTLHTYHVRRDYLNARFDLSKITPATRQPLELTFTNGFNGHSTSVKLMLPIAASERREDSRLNIDGVLADWDNLDAIQDGLLVRMLDRPSLQHQALQSASTASKIFTGWANDSFYVAFQLDGLSAAGGKAQNFVDYQFQRAWGEDLAELLIQPLSARGTLLPPLHVVCKPNGSVWVERKSAAKGSAGSWQPIAGADIRYATRTDGAHWSGEVAIPWRAILNESNEPPPALLRFNFTQHRTSTGESASWCGPVDFGRDEAFMGVLLLRDSNAPAIGATPLQ